MKKLSTDEILSLSTEQAIDIIDEYAKYFANGKGRVVEFKEKLPWPPDQILLAGLKLLKHSRKAKITADDDKYVEYLCALLNNLLDFIPSSEEYKELLELKKSTDERMESLDLIKD